MSILQKEKTMKLELFSFNLAPNNLIFCILTHNYQFNALKCDVNDFEWKVSFEYFLPSSKLIK